MAQKAVPSVNDLGGGKTLTEANVRDLIAGLMTASGSFVESGFAVPASAASLTIAVPAGVAYIDGYRVSIDSSTNVTVGASNTHYLFLTYTVDGSSNLLALAFTTNTTDVAPAKSVRIATLVAGSSTITSTVDRRKVGFNLNPGYQVQTPVKSTGIAATSAVNTDVIFAAETGMLLAVGLRFNSVTGASFACDLWIQTDGSASVPVTQLYSGGNPTAEYLILAQAAQQGAVIPYNIPYRSSIAVTFRISVAGSGGTIDVVTYRAKAL